MPPGHRTPVIRRCCTDVKLWNVRQNAKCNHENSVGQFDNNRVAFQQAYVQEYRFEKIGVRKRRIFSRAGQIDADMSGTAPADHEHRDRLAAVEEEVIAQGICKNKDEILQIHY